MTPGLCRRAFTEGAAGVWVALLAALCTSGCRQAPAGPERRPAPERAGSPLRPPARSGSTARQVVATGTAGRAAPDPAPCPTDMALAGRVCVDRYEDQLVVRQPDGGVRVHLWYERPRPGVEYVARSRAGVFPQAYVNRFESAAACRAAGKRLCTLREWFTACRGRRRTAYPYGPRERAGVCNSGKAHLLARFYGENPRFWGYRTTFNDPRLDQVPGFLAKTGAYSRCVTGSGLYDMVGNLHEWVSDTIEPARTSVVPVSRAVLARLGREAGHGVFMGGFYSTRDEHGNGCGFVTIGHQPSYHDYSTGFRCCSTPRSPKSGDPG